MKEYIGKGGEEVFKAKLNGLAEIAKEIGCNQSQLCIAWNIVNKDVTTTILGASKVQQVTDNLKALEVASKWTPELEERINKLLDNEPAPALDFNQFKPKKPRRGLRIDYSFGK